MGSGKLISPWDDDNVSHNGKNCMPCEKFRSKMFIQNDNLHHGKNRTPQEEFWMKMSTNYKNDKVYLGLYMFEHGKLHHVIFRHCAMMCPIPLLLRLWKLLCTGENVQTWLNVLWYCNDRIKSLWCDMYGLPLTEPHARARYTTLTVWRAGNVCVVGV